MEAKDGDALREYGKAATLFILSQVGDSEDATVFIESLANDEEVGHLLITSKENLGEVMKKMRDEPEAKGYKVFVSI